MKVKKRIKRQMGRRKTCKKRGRGRIRGGGPAHGAETQPIFVEAGGVKGK